MYLGMQIDGETTLVYSLDTKVDFPIKDNVFTPITCTHADN